MKFSIFKSVKASQGQECTYVRFLNCVEDKQLLKLLKSIADAPNANERQRLKKDLPVVTWQAYFEGRRVNAEAEPSGLYMLDIDHIDNPFKLYQDKVIPIKEECDVVLVHMTPSCKGLRVIAKCRPEFTTLAECQKWLADKIGVEFDAACKDWARASYLVHEWYIYYYDASLFTDEPDVVYDINATSDFDQSAFESFQAELENQTVESSSVSTVDQREGLFGGDDNYKGVEFSRIIEEWFRLQGGEPVEGDRNTKLHRLATRLRYICDFNEATLLRVMPSYGLPEAEMKQLIHSAVTSSRASGLPRDMQDVLDSLDAQIKLGDIVDDGDDLEFVKEKFPTFPPIIKEFVESAPKDFKKAVALCQLPILGALGSKLRAKYLDGKIHSPSFQVSLEAPQASGKSFLTRLVEYELKQMMEYDDEQRLREREYDNKVRELKLLNVKINVDNKEEILGSRPKSMIRFVPPTMSITKLLMRCEAAKGLHLFAFAPEIDTITKAFKRGFSSYSDLLRVAFDNDLYGQDYASENSFSGIIPIYYNMLASGTPKAMCRFYPDVEDGLVSRVCFVTLPDQFGKELPVFQNLDEKAKMIVDINLVRLNEISLIGEDVQPDHEMNLDFLCEELQKWIKKQQKIAVREDDRTRDIFCRRAAVVGFRAGMLAYFLWGEKRTRGVKNKTVKFATWVADSMLSQHLLRFNMQQVASNVLPYKETYDLLHDEFTRGELRVAMAKSRVQTHIRQVVYKWKLGGMIDVVETKKGARGHMTDEKFIKINKR